MNSFTNFKNILIISDSYVPQKISAAGMIYNLSKEIAGNNIRVVCAFSGINKSKIKTKYDMDGIELIQTKFLMGLRNKSLISRFIFEIGTSVILSIKCFYYFKKNEKPDLIIWYGPSVFLWMVVKTINFSRKIPVYYILRDIFPDWLISLKVIKNFFVVSILKLISYPQYTVSDVIGVESIENVNYLKNKLKNKNIELLPNWSSLVSNDKKKIDDKIKINFKQYISKKSQSQIFKTVYIGNSSLAHDYNSAVNFFNSFNDLNLSVNIFSKNSNFNHINNKLISQKNWELVNDYNFPFIFSKMDCGIVALNRLAKTNNIPGKFVSYVQFGLPTICFANIKSSLSKLILAYNCGIVIDLSENQNMNKIKFLTFVENFKANRKSLSENALKLFKDNFDSKTIVQQILRKNYD